MNDSQWVRSFLAHWLPIHAGQSVVRKRGKNILPFAILLIMATFVLIWLEMLLLKAWMYQQILYLKLKRAKMGSLRIPCIDCVDKSSIKKSSESITVRSSFLFSFA